MTSQQTTNTPHRQRAFGPIFMGHSLHSSEELQVEFNRIPLSVFPEPVPDVLQAFMNEAAKIQKKILERTVIIPGFDENYKPGPGFKDLIQEKLRSYLHGSGAIYVMQADGRAVYTIPYSDGVLSKAFPLSTLLQKTEEMYEKKKDLIRYTSEQRYRQNAKLTSLQAGESLIDLGSGNNTERIAILQKYAKEKEAHLICTDLLPICNQQLKKTEACSITIAEDPELVVPLLQTLPRPAVIIGENLISALSTQTLKDCIETIRRVNPEKFILTIGASLDNAGNYYPEGLAVGKSKFQYRVKKLIQQALEQGKWKRFKGKERFLKLQEIVQRQVEDTYRQIIYEAAIRYLHNALINSSELRCFQFISDTHGKTLERRDTEEFLAGRANYLLEKFEQGSFNTFHLNPFLSSNLSKNDSLCKGEFCVENTQYQLVFSKTPYTSPDEQDTIPGVLHKSNTLDHNGYFIPSDLRYLTPMHFPSPGDTIFPARDVTETRKLARNIVLSILFKEAAGPVHSPLFDALKEEGLPFNMKFYQEKYRIF